MGNKENVNAVFYNSTYTRGMSIVFNERVVFELGDGIEIEEDRNGTLKAHIIRKENDGEKGTDIS